MNSPARPREMTHEEAEASRLVADLDRTHGRALYATICKQCRALLDPHGCLDVYQRVLLAFWSVVKKKLDAGTFDQKDPIRLALGVATRVIRNAKRKARRTACEPLTQEMAQAEPPADGGTLGRQELLNAVSTLSPIQRQVLNAYLDHLGETGRTRGGRYRRIADHLGMDPVTVRSVFRRAVVKLRTHLIRTAKQSV